MPPEPTSRPHPALVAVTGLVALCLITGVLWGWQSHRHSLRHGGDYHLLDRGGGDFLQQLSAYSWLQTLHDGEAPLNYFTTLLFNSDERLTPEGEELRPITSISGRVLIPAETWVDVVARQSFRGGITFRLSRAPLIPSGWYVFKDDRCLVHQPVDTGALLPPDALSDGRRRTDLKIFNWKHPLHSRELIDTEFDSRWVEVSVRREGRQFQAWLDGRLISTFDLDVVMPVLPAYARGENPRTAEPQFFRIGRWGFRAGDTPPIRLDWAHIEGREINGQPFSLLASFDPPTLSAMEWLRLIALHCLRLLGAALALCAALALLLPGLSLARVIWWIAGAVSAVGVITLWVEWRGLIEAWQSVPVWRGADAAVILGVCALLLVRHRRAMRFHFSRWHEETLDWRAACVWALIAGIALAGFAFSISALRWDAPSPNRSREIAEGPPRHWSEEMPLHIPLSGDRMAALLFEGEWEFTLEDSDAELEVYLQRRDLEVSSLPEWDALRVTAEGMAFTSSRGLENRPDGPAIEIGVPHTLTVRLRDGEATATVRRSESEEAPARATARLPWQNAGGVGMIARWGSGSVQPHSGQIAEVRRQRIENRTITLKAHAKPLVLIFAAVGLSVALGLGLGAMTALLGRAAASPCLWWSVVSIAGGMVVALWRLESVFDLGDVFTPWLAESLLWAAALTVIALWYLFWVTNFERMRMRQLISLSAVIALFLCGEMLVRSGPMREIWRVRTTPGYVVREFLFADTAKGMIWQSHTGERFTPIEKRKEERRVICIGGSSTLGVGVPTLRQTYPAILEKRLRSRSGDSHWRVLNAGWPNFTVLDNLLAWRRDLRRLKPDVAVLYVSGNDNISTNWPAVTEPESLEMVESMNRDTLMNRFMQPIFDLRTLVGLQAGRRHLQGAGNIDAFVERLPPEDFERYLREMITEMRADGVTVVLAPEVLVESFSLRDHSLVAHHAIMEELAEEFDLPIVDTAGAFRARRLDMLMSDYIHPNSLGNQLLAGIVADAVLLAESASPEP
jgi:lysophospholipase L1-like esterase